MTLCSPRVKLEDSGRPWSVVFLSILLKQRRVIFDVNACSDEVVVDEFDDPGVRPHLGIQPSTAASHRSSAEVEQHRLIRLCRLGEHRIYVVTKTDWHLTGPPLRDAND